MIDFSSIVGFIGDPNFPSRGQESASKGTKIVYFQEIFKEYSKLNFTNDTDKPIAIAGLESRLQRAYNCAGPFGIFGNREMKSFYHRSLLWRRESDTTRLRRIDFSSSHSPISVPSWSWMAYKGPIDYLAVEFDKVTWSDHKRLSPPFVSNESALTGTHTDMLPARQFAIRAETFAYNELGREKDASVIHLDLKLVLIQRKYRCVVVGVTRSSLPEQKKMHYVLIVTHKGNSKDRIFERVGVACMLGSQIDLRKGIQGVIV